MKLPIVVFLLCLSVSAAWGAAAPVFQGEYGKLTIYSDVLGADIYVDAKFVGQDRATISNIPEGKHYVRVVKEENTIQSGLVDVRGGEETIIVAKQTEEELLARMRRPNYLVMFGGMTSVGYNISPAAWGLFSSLTYSPQYGVGAEIRYAVPVVDVNVHAGFVLNYPSTITFPTSTETGFVWQNGKVSLSSPYICVSKEFLKAGPLRISAGGGFNYALYNPGGSVQLSIEPRLGYEGFIEAFRQFGEGQQLVLKVGYANYSGKAAGVSDISSPGYFLRGGFAYQL